MLSGSERPSQKAKLNERENLKILHYRKRESASYIVREVRSVREREREREIQRERERERERERGERETETDRRDVTIFALKLAMSSHFPLPKIRTFRFSLHTSRLSLLKWSPLWR